MAPLFRITSTCKGGGYRYCRTKPKHPRANAKGLYPLHRVLMENKLGRFLESSEVVHHIDGDPTHDCPSNLEVLVNATHSRLHARRVSKMTVGCDWCGTPFSITPHLYRLRAKRAKWGVHCSRQCAGLAGHHRKRHASRRS